MGAAFRFYSGDRAYTRRTAHEQGPSACGVLGDGETDAMEVVFQKGILKGLDRLSSKCNSLEEDLERRAPAKPLAGPVVDQIQNALKFRL